MTWRGRRYSKFKAKKTVVDGILFDSIGESRRYGELKLLEKAGAIRELRVHPAYPIDINCIRVCVVVPDFRYVDVATGKIVVEDFKSPVSMTPVYRLKKRLVAALHGIDIKEVFANKRSSA